MFDYELALMTGVDLPIPEIQATLHPPTLKEISLIGENTFFMGIQLLSIDKSLYAEENPMLAQISNFQFFMSVLGEQQMADKKASVQQTLTLLFPQAKVLFTPRSIILKFTEAESMIDEGNFEVFREIIKKCFCLKNSGQDTFNPQSAKAKEIAKKLMKARQKVAELKSKEGGGSAFAQYISALTVGLGSMSLNDCVNLTMYQLYDLIERYGLYINWDLDIKSRLAGASGDKPVENWMKPIH